MLPRVNLNMDVLRTFVTGLELGSFSKAAQRLGRSQSAISTQLRRLEEQAGKPLFKKSGRGLALTSAGESLLSYAKRILELNDEAIDGLKDAEVEGWVRLGIPQDFAEGWLTGVLGQFARSHPKVRVEVRAEQNVAVIERLVQGELDLALPGELTIKSMQSDLSTYRWSGLADPTGRAPNDWAQSPCPWSRSNPLACFVP